MEQEGAWAGTWTKFRFMLFLVGFLVGLVMYFFPGSTGIGVALIILVVALITPKYLIKIKNVEGIETECDPDLEENLDSFLDSINSIMKGGLLQEINIKGDKRIEVIADKFNEVLNSINNFVLELDNISEDSLDTSRRLSEASEQTSRALKSVNMALKDLTETTEQMSTSVEEISESADEIEHLTEEGLGQMKQMEGEMDKIIDSSSAAEKSVRSLNSAAEEIEEIVKVISAIVDQTNLLALNAAIEAARAGEEGRGFAVVAEEVRQLASNAGDSLEEITELVANLREEVNKTAGIIEHSNEEIKSGDKVMQETVEKFKVIAGNIDTISGEIDEAAAAGQQIFSSASEISGAMEEQTDSAEEIADLSGNLSDMAADLKETLADNQFGALEIDFNLAKFDKNFTEISPRAGENLKQKIGIDSDFILSVIARLEPMKGHDFFFSGFKEFLQSGNNAECLIIGDGSREEELKKQVVSEGIEGFVKFLGYREDIQQLLLISDLIVLTSRKEGGPPQILMEAMAASRPIVATDISGNRELVVPGETGLLVPYGKEDELGKALRYMRENREEAVKYGNNGRRRIEKLV